MVSREEALGILTRYLKDERMVKHCIAVGAVMRALARRLGEDQELWGVVGLLHDVDYDYVGRDMGRHGLGALEILRGVLPQYALEAIAAHNEHNGFKPSLEESARLAHALRASDHLSGLIVATALVMPGKKLAEVKVDVVRGVVEGVLMLLALIAEAMGECGIRYGEVRVGGKLSQYYFVRYVLSNLLRARVLYPRVPDAVHVGNSMLALKALGASGRELQQILDSLPYLAEVVEPSPEAIEVYGRLLKQFLDLVNRVYASE